jgi:hypothetical protein
MATELAYGNCGFIPTMEMSANQSELARREYTYILPVQKRYANATAQSITYNDNGAEVDASEYIRRHPATFADCKSADFMSQIKITYDNGVVVCVNRHPTRPYSVSVGNAGGWFSAHALVNSKDSLCAGTSNATNYLLPQKNGWVAYLPQQTMVRELRSCIQQINMLRIASNPLPSAKISIQFFMRAGGPARIDIRDISGKLISTPVDGFQTAGSKTMLLNASDNKGRELPSGMYICALKTQSTVFAKTFLFFK